MHSFFLTGAINDIDNLNLRNGCTCSGCLHSAPALLFSRRSDSVTKFVLYVHMYHRQTPNARELKLSGFVDKKNAHKSEAGEFLCPVRSGQVTKTDYVARLLKSLIAIATILFLFLLSIRNVIRTMLSKIRLSQFCCICDKVRSIRIR